MQTTAVVQRFMRPATVVQRLTTPQTNSKAVSTPAWLRAPVATIGKTSCASGTLRAEPFFVHSCLPLKCWADRAHAQTASHVCGASEPCGRNHRQLGIATNGGTASRSSSVEGKREHRYRARKRARRRHSAASVLQDADGWANKSVLQTPMIANKGSAWQAPPKSKGPAPIHPWQTARETARGAARASPTSKRPGKQCQRHMQTCD